MWLLNVNSRKLVSFMDDRAANQKYAILSHTWEHEEVSFQDIHQPRSRQMAGYQKIDYLCTQASLDGLEYAWIDTCCINKESSSDLTEAINSMFRWYQNAAVCYAYLEDVSIYGTLMPASWIQDQRDEVIRRLLQNSKWFTRGWTLQELVGPKSIAFYDTSWIRVGIIDKADATSREQRPGSLRLNRSDPTISQMASAISAITRIDEAVLAGDVTLATCCIAQRLSWAAYRRTTRIEDEAYCLLGLLGVNMPLLYGEGARAFSRLQETVVATTLDHSLLAWKPYLREQCHLLLAPDSYCFRLATDMVNKADPSVDSEYMITNRGLRMTLPVTRSRDPSFILARLQCRRWSDKSLFALRLRYVGPSDPKTFRRGPRPYEIVRTMSIDDERYWTGDSRSRWFDLVLLKEPLNLTIAVEISGGLGIMTAGVGDIGRHWHGNLLEFSIPQGVYDPVFIEIMDVTTKEKKLLSLLRWRLDDLIVGWTDRRAYWTTRTKQLRLGDAVLASARKDNIQTWRIPGTIEIVEAEVWAAGSSSVPSGRELPEHTVILRIWKETHPSEFSSVWASCTEDVRHAAALRIVTNVLSVSQAATTPNPVLVLAALRNDASLLAELYATKLADFVAELRDTEITVQDWTAAAYHQNDDVALGQGILVDLPD